MSNTAEFNSAKSQTPCSWLPLYSVSNTAESNSQSLYYRRVFVNICMLLLKYYGVSGYLFWLRIRRVVEFDSKQSQIPLCFGYFAALTRRNPEHRESDSARSQAFPSPTPQSLKHWEVQTPRCLKYQEVCKTCP